MVDMLRRLAILAFLFIAPTASAQLFIMMGDLPGGDDYSNVFSVSSTTSPAVASVSRSTTTDEGVRWQPGGNLEAVPHPLLGYSTALYGISADGQHLVGRSFLAAGIFAVRYSPAFGMQNIGDLPGGTINAIAFDVSADGSVIVGYGTSANGTEAFRWTEATGMVALGDLPGGAFLSNGRAVSDNGAVVVGISAAADGGYAFRWTQGGGMVSIGELPGGGENFSFAEDVSGDGLVVVGRSVSEASGPGKAEAFRWTARDGMVGLGDLPGGDLDSNALAVSGNGSIIIGYGHTDNGFEGFIWDEVNGMRNLRDYITNDLGQDLSQWESISPNGISNDGRFIVGGGTLVTGQSRGWLLDRGANAIACPGDLNGDNQANLDDLQLLLFYFGNSCP